MDRRDQAINDTTEDWKDLGFFYDLDEKSKCWKIIGSRIGLMKFCKILDDYVSDSRNEKISEHDHLGPYMYLTITTWKCRELDESGIVGTLPDIAFMSNLVKDKLSKCEIGGSFAIGSEYDEKTEYKMIFQIMSEGDEPDGKNYVDFRHIPCLIGIILARWLSANDRADRELKLAWPTAIGPTGLRDEPIEFAKKHPDCSTALESWYRIVKNTTFNSFAVLNKRFRVLIK